MIVRVRCHNRVSTTAVAASSTGSPRCGTAADSDHVIDDIANDVTPKGFMADDRAVPGREVFTNGSP